MPTTKGHDWKILIIDHNATQASEVEKELKTLGFPNVVVDGTFENEKASDEKFVELIKQTNWDAVVFGAGINGFTEHLPHEITAFHWFNRLVNLAHLHASNVCKFIFINGSQDLINGFIRVLSADETE